MIVISGYSQKDSNLVFLNVIKADTLNKQELGGFYNHFPQSFERFYEYYGDSGSPLYYLGRSHVQIYRKCSSVVDSITYITNLINIGIEGRWDADAVSWMQKLIKDEFIARNDLFCSELIKYKEEEIVSFFMFYMDKVRFKKSDFPKELNVLQVDHLDLYNYALSAKQRLLTIYK